MAWSSGGKPTNRIYASTSYDINILCLKSQPCLTAGTNTGVSQDSFFSRMPFLTTIVGFKVKVIVMHQATWLGHVFGF